MKTYTKLEYDRKNRASFCSKLLVAIVGSMVGSTIIIKSIGDKIQQGYINPNDIIKRDFDKSDGEGLRETYLKVGDKLYELKYDSQNNPIIIEKGDR